MWNAFVLVKICDFSENHYVFHSICSWFLGSLAFCMLQPWISKVEKVFLNESSSRYVPGVTCPSLCGTQFGYQVSNAMKQVGRALMMPMMLAGAGSIIGIIGIPFLLWRHSGALLIL